MKLLLDDTQRLNLHALMGAQRCSVDDVRFWWKLQDRIDLSDKEREAIHFTVQEINGQQQATWNPNLRQKPHEYEFTADEFARVVKLVKEWQPGFLTTSDRRWLEPLLVQLDNGQPKT
jgi:hypothetical protein